MASWKQELLWIEVVINMVNSPVVRSFPIFDCRMVSMLMADRVLERWSIIVHKIGIFSHGLLIYSKSRCLLYSRNCLDKKKWSSPVISSGANRRCQHHFTHLIFFAPERVSNMCRFPTKPWFLRAKFNMSWYLASSKLSFQWSFGRYIAAFRYLLALLGRLLPVYYRLGLLLLMVSLDQDWILKGPLLWLLNFS